MSYRHVCSETRNIIFPSTLLFDVVQKECFDSWSVWYVWSIVIGQSGNKWQWWPLMTLVNL